MFYYLTKKEKKLKCIVNIIKLVLEDVFVIFMEEFGESELCNHKCFRQQKVFRIKEGISNSLGNLTSLVAFFFLCVCLFKLYKRVMDRL